ncbi:TPA: hypothetical protein ACGG5K_001533 [Legionella pneumophila]|uniref:hypothetical protein n=1 Tax=Legionella pneumophila TaxID=446 RepID=UPI000489CCBC|nr:hypothetical protein [Legionella pneumophila]BCL64361.1 hypothetical protein [Legionella pneumophila serogroup 2]MCK1858157.1 hypothetical protein [Legionella pneumophila]RYW93378.1 hypothetical protein D7217_03585 [Legionella pneumophila]STX98257.1 methionyl-tRNA formyltransferase [Legionella pneumophila]HAT1774457.1 hypothetical protein [Legionella pneumophila]
MKYNQIDKVILFGGAPLLVATANWLKSNNFRLIIYTSPRHAVEPLDETGLTLKETLERLEVSYVITENINSEPTLKQEITPNTLGLGMGEAWSFSEEIINQFQGRLLDFMGIPHPRYRGGAHYTWMILRNDKQGGCNLQVINKDMIQGIFDSGGIVKTSSYRFSETARIPMDYFNEAVNHEVAFIKEFFDEIKQGKEFNLMPPDESKSLYLPRLNTINQAWINWDWDGEEIERFICAFDNPYAGASTFLNNIRVHLKSCKLDKSEACFHPFQSGLITRITPKEGVVIATRSGHLSVKHVINYENDDISKLLKIGQRFYTPIDNIEYGMQYHATYGTKAKIE